MAKKSQSGPTIPKYNYTNPRSLFHQRMNRKLEGIINKTYTFFTGKPIEKGIGKGRKSRLKQSNPFSVPKKATVGPKLKRSNPFSVPKYSGHTGLSKKRNKGLF